MIATEALERTVVAIADMVEEARRHQVRATGAVGTAGLRSARNREEVIAHIAARTGLTVEVIPGEEESRLAYLAARAGLGMPEGSLVVFDTGGGSTEFTFGRGSEVEEHFSLAVGAVGYTERFGLANSVDPGGAGRGRGGDRRRPGPHRWPPPTRCPCRGWAAR